MGYSRPARVAVMFALATLGCAVASEVSGAEGSDGDVYVALRRSGCPTTARGAERPSVKPDASAGPAPSARANAAAATADECLHCDSWIGGTSRGEARPAR